MEIFGIGLPEIILVLVLALIVFGPERLPKIARELGSTLANIRREAEGIRQEFIASMETVENPMRESIDELRSAFSLAPPRPAPLELDAPRPAADLPTAGRDDAAVAATSVTNVSRSNVAAPRTAHSFAPAKAMPLNTAAVDVDAPVNTSKLQNRGKHRQASPTKPQPRVVADEATRPSAPTTPPPLLPPSVPSIEPSFVPTTTGKSLPLPLPDVLQASTDYASAPAADDADYNPFASDMLMPYSEAAVAVGEAEPAGFSQRT